MTVHPGSTRSNIPLLIPVHGPGDRRPRPLEHEAATVGRARGCDLCLEASDVSTVHCLLFRSGAGYHVRDCNSRAGTRVNGETIRGDRPLRDGDILQVGPFSFELHLPAAPTGSEVADLAQVLHYAQSRRRLAEHALRLRRLLRERAGGAIQRETDAQHELARLREKTTIYDRRLRELNEAEQELEAERAQVRERMQQVEREIAQRFAEAEEQLRTRWQEFQRRCQGEEAALAGRLQQQEYENMKHHLENGQAGHAQQEAQLRSQRAELARMIGELRQLQEELRRPVQEQLKQLGDENERLRSVLADYEARLAKSPVSVAAKRELEQTRNENDLLRMLLQERERELTEAMERLQASPADTGAAEQLGAENARLTQVLAEKDALVAELTAKAAVKPARPATELERYEAELNQERLDLDRERAKLTTELEQLRARNQELDEATRDMEMEMSRERAELARERIRMERMREELKVDVEKLQREMSVRESLAPVQRLREELSQKRPGAKPPESAVERLRQLRSGNDTPRS